MAAAGATEAAVTAEAATGEESSKEATTGTTISTTTDNAGLVPSTQVGQPHFSHSWVIQVSATLQNPTLEQKHG